jgi:SAM-dependent methyltransferase
MENTPAYKYYRTCESNSSQDKIDNQKIQKLAMNRLNPCLNNPDYLVLNYRRKIISNWINALKVKSPVVLDVGGRIPTYRSLFKESSKQYISLDPIFNSVIDVVGIGENLPFRNNTIDFVVCTQVLSYVMNPFKVVDEIYRVLVPEGALIMTTPTFFPKHHNERWRFLPEGIEILLSCFSKLYIEPEGNSVCGLFRTANVCLKSLPVHEKLRTIIRRLFIPANNMAGSFLDRFSRSEFITPNYCALAIK